MDFEMSSISSTSAGVADLMQMLSSVGDPALSSLLSSQVQSGLGKASAADLVRLSDQAMQLQEVNGFFPSTAPTPTESTGMAMQDLLTSIYSPGSNINLLG